MRLLMGLRAHCSRGAAARGAATWAVCASTPGCERLRTTSCTTSAGSANSDWEEHKSEVVLEESKSTIQSLRNEAFQNKVLETNTDLIF